MPKREIDYSKTVFYKIVCLNLEIHDCYVGSTTNFNQRKSQHKGSCKYPTCSNYNHPVYKFIRANGDWENWEMIPIEQASLANRLDVLKKEREYIEALHATLNCQVPSQSKKEYREKNKEIIHQKQHEYTVKNKEHKQQYDREYRERNKEKKKENDRNYYLANCDKVKARQNEYYYQTYDQQEMVICPKCGSSIRCDYLKKHQKTKKCSQSQER